MMEEQGHEHKLRKRRCLKTKEEKEDVRMAERTQIVSWKEYLVEYLCDQS